MFEKEALLPPYLCSAGVSAHNSRTVKDGMSSAIQRLQGLPKASSTLTETHWKELEKIARSKASDIAWNLGMRTMYEQDVQIGITEGEGGPAATIVMIFATPDGKDIRAMLGTFESKEGVLQGTLSGTAAFGTAPDQDEDWEEQVKSNIGLWDQALRDSIAKQGAADLRPASVYSTLQELCKSVKSRGTEV